LLWTIEGFGVTDASETVTSPLRLESLVPRFVSDQHGTYRDELVDLLTDDDRRARVWNIALRGVRQREE
jgi:hypothetical protein